jgi:ABC-type transport system involved in multi-copper enzyme maturation permease subunit
MQKDSVEGLLREVIAASDRTTRAVRAFVIFLFLQLTFTTIAGLLFWVGSSTYLSYGVPMVVLALLIWFVGLILSITLGWIELSQSRFNLKRPNDINFTAQELAKQELENEQIRSREEHERLQRERIYNEKKKLRSERKKLRAKRIQGILSNLKKPWVMGISLLVTLSVVASGVIFFVSTTSWSSVVKQCDSLMTQNALGVDDSYTLNGSNDELTLIVGTEPRESEWVDCIGKSLSVGAPNDRLGRTVENRLRASQDSISFGNLRVEAQTLDDDSYKIVITPLD